MSTRAEINFKVFDVPLDPSKESDIKSYLEKSITGLSITSLTTEGDKVTVTSNILSLLMAPDEDEPTRQKLRELQLSVDDQEYKLRGIRLELQQKEEAYNELEEYNNNLESDYQLSENQIEILQMKLEEDDKLIATLKKQVQNLEKLEKTSETSSTNAKQKLESLEQELKRKDRDCRLKEEQLKSIAQEFEGKIKLLKVQAERAEKLAAARDAELKGKNVPDSELIQARDEALRTVTELLTTKDELNEKKLKLAELNLKYEDACEALAKSMGTVTQQEQDLTVLRNRLREFESLSDNLDTLEKTRKQLEDLQGEHAKLKKSAEESTANAEQAARLQRQKDDLVKELTALKSYLFETENKLMNSSASTKEGEEKQESQKFKVVEEIKQAMNEILCLCKALDTASKEMLASFQEKKEKMRECEKFMVELQRTISKEDKLNMLQGLTGTSFAFLGGIPKKLRYLQMMEDCMSAVIKQKHSKTQVYDDNISKYEKLINIISGKFAEYEQKLSCY
ncbi:MAG: hypothetical protein P4L67_04245 [Candidatus Pacebacteria bacterium]|nr:hypothetical protein [Candidatus Paceibacterota bacterium]